VLIVTGVQTCALPIWRGVDGGLILEPVLPAQRARGPIDRVEGAIPGPDVYRVGDDDRICSDRVPGREEPRSGESRRRRRGHVRRSEERRVGKECRYGG